jgi:hypothetical protein
MRQLIVLFVATRLALALTVVLALAYLTPASCAFCADVSPSPLLAGLARWDGAAYLDIARGGYVGVGREDLAAFFPLYPMLMWLGGTVAGGSDDAYLVMGILVSNGACLGAAILLMDLARTRLDPAPSTRAAGYLLIFPTTIFLSAVYADSLFLALAVGSALEATRGHSWRSAMLAALAALGRPFGILALLPLAASLWRRRGSVAWTDALPLALAPLVLALWIVYLYVATGDPLALLHGYASGFQPRHPLQAFTDLFDPSVYGFPWFVAGSFALFVFLVVRSWRVAGPELATFATAMFLVIATAGSLASSMRYELSIFPAFMVLGAIARRPAWRIAWSAASCVLALVFTAMFALWLWIG